MSLATDTSTTAPDVPAMIHRLAPRHYIASSIAPRQWTNNTLANERVNVLHQILITELTTLAQSYGPNATNPLSNQEGVAAQLRIANAVRTALAEDQYR
jgi:hypothetical protein